MFRVSHVTLSVARRVNKFCNLDLFDLFVRLNFWTYIKSWRLAQLELTPTVFVWLKTINFSWI